MAAVETYLQLTLVRHGETTANKERIIQGQLDTALSEHGRNQSQRVGQRLAAAEIISHIYCSDLSRAVQTAEVIRGELGYSVAVTLDERLRERASHEGRPLTELVDAARQAGVSVKDYTPSGGETQDSVDERLSFFLGDLCRAVCKMNLQHAIPRKDGGLLEPTLPSPHWHVLLVSHGGALHALCEQLRQLHACELPHRHIATPNASISSFFLTLQDQSCHSARTLTAHNTKHLEHLSR